MVINLEKSEVVIAKILSLLLEWGIQETQLEFQELELDDSFAPFFFPCAEWLEAEGIIRFSNLQRFQDSIASGRVARPVLTASGFATLGKSISVNGQTETLSEGVNKISASESSLWQVGDAIGGILGGLTKSMGS
ncbi:hypothetical protein N9571_02240 [Yoonia sp.]|uniref:hypothetical protein n=1 Tax=Yoonia sp. TaxID=2212373 RepID=UPI0023738D86|nr:hypothetical protein [Yoonia sp.]MDB4111367.1 hypothetical protein [Yoonia sp.]